MDMNGWVSIRLEQYPFHIVDSLMDDSNPEDPCLLFHMEKI